MNLNHVFLFSSPKKICALKTDRRGKELAGYVSGIGYSDNSEFPRKSAAISDMAATLGTETPAVIVTAFADKDISTFASVFPIDSCIWLDIRQLAWPLVMHSAISKERTLKELCAHFGVQVEANAEGSQECLVLCSLYWAMMTRYKTSLFGEEVIREAGGKALGTIRSFFGV